MAIGALAISELHHSYAGGKVVLADINLTVRKGEFVTFLGPSGCGKTTLLRIIGGFLEPTQGRVLLNGKDVTSDPAHKRNVNLVFQRVTLFPHLNVFDNIAFGMRLNGRSKAEIASRVAECLALVRLPGYEKRAVSSLSGGQAQRVSLARALANRPEILLLDEPLSALDFKVRLELEAELRRLHRSEGLTIIFVTHDQREALALSDRIALFHEGRITQLAAPAELYQRPNSEFAASFIGDANVIPVEVEAAATGASVVFNGIRVPAPSATALAGAGQLVVRQEDLLLSLQTSSSQSFLKGRIIDLGYRGSGYSCHIAVEGFATPFKAEVPPELGAQLSVGSAVGIGWAPEKAWLTQR